MNQSINNKGIGPIDGIRRGRPMTLDLRSARGRWDFPAPVPAPPAHSWAWGKLAVVLVLAGGLFLEISSVGTTSSYFNDTETSRDNIMRAGVAGLTLADPPPDGNINSESFDVAIGQASDSLPLLYTVKGELGEGSPSVCAGLALTGRLGSYEYDGPFSDFDLPATSTMGVWQFTVFVPDQATTTVEAATSSAAVCSGSLVFKARLSGVSSTTAEAFTDEKRYDFSLQVINTAIDPPPADPSPDKSSDKEVGEGIASSSPEGGEATSSPSLLATSSLSIVSGGGGVLSGTGGGESGGGGGVPPAPEVPAPEAASSTDPTPEAITTATTTVAIVTATDAIATTTAATTTPGNLTGSTATSSPPDDTPPAAVVSASTTPPVPTPDPSPTPDLPPPVPDPQSPAPEPQPAVPDSPPPAPAPNSPPMPDSPPPAADPAPAPASPQ